MVLPFLLPVAPPGILSDGYRGKMGFRPFRPALDFDAVSGGRAMAGLCAISASVRPIARPGAGGPLLPGICSSRNFRKRYAKGQCLAWPARGGECREHGSSRLRIPPHRREARKSTSGAAARGVTQQWRCGRLSTRASMMPILFRRARWTYATTLLRNVKRPFSSFQKESSGTLHFTCAISLRCSDDAGSGQHRHLRCRSSG